MTERLEADRELVEAALALDYWPGKRTRANYSAKMLRFLKAKDAALAVRLDGGNSQ